MDRSIMEKAKNTKEENLKSKESENCLHIQKYLEIIPKNIPCCRGKMAWSHRAFDILLGE